MFCMNDGRQATSSYQCCLLQVRICAPQKRYTRVEQIVKATMYYDNSTSSNLKVLVCKSEVAWARAGGRRYRYALARLTAGRGKLVEATLIAPSQSHVALFDFTNVHFHRTGRNVSNVCKQRLLFLPIDEILTADMEEYISIEQKSRLDRTSLLTS